MYVILRLLLNKNPSVLIHIQSLRTADKQQVRLQNGCKLKPDPNRGALHKAFLILLETKRSQK